MSIRSVHPRGALDDFISGGYQSWVPFLSETTLFGTPALISACAPMMLRVRPPQLTTTVVSETASGP